MNIGTASARRKEREQEALRFHSEGLSIKKSAERMGVSIESVRRYLRSNGVPFVRKQKPRGKKLPCGSLTTCHALLVMLFEDGCGKSEIASMCGCSESNVANFVAGNMYPSADHVVPLRNGGTHTPGNLRIAHRLCNALKSDKSIEYAKKAISERLSVMPG